MKIAITTPTGHVGSAVVDFLLDLGGDIELKLLGRRPEKLRDFARRGAKMAIGAQDNVDYLVQATQGVDALYWATPPGYGSDNVRAFQNRLGKAAATAIRTNRIPRVVNLSSIGAELESGAGPISGLHDVERLLDEVRRQYDAFAVRFLLRKPALANGLDQTFGNHFAADLRVAALPHDCHPRYWSRGGGAVGRRKMDRAQRPRVARAGRLEL